MARQLRRGRSRARRRRSTSTSPSPPRSSPCRTPLRRSLRLRSKSMAPVTVSSPSPSPPTARRRRGRSRTTRSRSVAASKRRRPTSPSPSCLRKKRRSSSRASTRSRSVAASRRPPTLSPSPPPTPSRNRRSSSRISSRSTPAYNRSPSPLTSLSPPTPPRQRRSSSRISSRSTPAYNRSPSPLTSLSPPTPPRQRRRNSRTSTRLTRSRSTPAINRPPILSPSSSPTPPRKRRSNSRTSTRPTKSTRSRSAVASKRLPSPTPSRRSSSRVSTRSRATPFTQSNDYYLDLILGVDGVNARFCAVCRRHEVVALVRGHRGNCPFAACKCALCVEKKTVVAADHALAVAPTTPPQSRKDPVDEDAADAAAVLCLWCGVECANEEEASKHSLAHAEPDADDADLDGEATAEKKGKTVPDRVLVGVQGADDTFGVELQAPSAPSAPSALPPSLDCGECSLSFETRLQQARHRVATHAFATLHACPTCNAKFYSRTRQRVHVAWAHDVLRFACPACADRFPSLLLADAHRAVDHGERLQLQCPLCGAACSTAGQLTAHIRAFHGGSQPLSCALCPRPFDNISSLLLHHRGHLAAMRRQHCDVCLAWFPAPELVRAHHDAEHVHVGRDVAGNPARSVRFACPCCDAHRASAADLDEHLLRTHQGALPYCCPCGARFGDLRSFSGHAVDSLHLPALAPPATSECQPCGPCGVSSADPLFVTEHQERDHMELLPLDRVGQLLALVQDAAFLAT